MRVSVLSNVTGSRANLCCIQGHSYCELGQVEKGASDDIFVSGMEANERMIKGASFLYYYSNRTIKNDDHHWFPNDLQIKMTSALLHPT